MKRVPWRQLVTRIRVKPRQGSLYVLVLIFATKQAMRTYWKHECLKPGIKTVALCHSYKRYRVRHSKRTRLHPDVATVTFWRHRMGTGVLTHELMHATLAVARRLKLDLTKVYDDKPGFIPRDHPEEELCYMHGEMVRQLVDRAWKLGVYE